jgi:dihydrodipicolinate synthase/N-acetylneuraminate lyase
VVPTGTTGEFTTLSTAEHKRVTEQVIQAAAGRVKVISGLGSVNTAVAVDLARHASDAGADAVMVVPPFYDAINTAELTAYLTAVSDVVEVPIVYYNVPGVTGVQLSADEIAALSDIDGVQYLKDTSGDAVCLTNLLFHHADRITAFNGWDTLTFVGLASGAKASVWGTAMIVPELAVELWDTLAVRKDLEAARALWKTVWPICDVLESVNYVAGIKGGLELIGKPAGPAREPVLALTDEDKSRLATVLRNAGVTVVESATV